MPDTPDVTHEDFKPYDDTVAAFVNLTRKRISVASTVSGGGLQGTFSDRAEGQVLASIDHVHTPGRPLHSEIIFNPARNDGAFNHPAPVTYAVTLDMDVIDDRISLTFDTYRHGQLDASARAQDHVLSPTCLNRVLHEWFEGVGGPYAQMPQIPGLQKLVKYEAV